MDNPVLVEVIRGRLVESRHRGAVAVVDADGKTMLALGDGERPVYPRSAVKALQALPLIETGAADRFGLGDQELALACASHGGEPDHTAAAVRMLGRAGLEPSALACGTHWPIHQPSAQALARSGAVATALHNNCSGKHAGFLCTACAFGVDHHGYGGPSHAVQRQVRRRSKPWPVWLSPRRPVRSTAARRRPGRCRSTAWRWPSPGSAPATACRPSAPRQPRDCARRAPPIPGTSPVPANSAPRSCSVSASGFSSRPAPRAFFRGALPEQGLGIAVKCDDGATRAAEVVMAALIAKLLPIARADERTALAAFVQPPLRNWNAREVGLFGQPRCCCRRVNLNDLRDAVALRFKFSH